MAKVVRRKVDGRGRITIPKEWRDKFKASEFVLVLRDDRIELYPRASDLTKLVDSVEVDELPSDWHELKREVFKP
ncbi:MAG: AbrB/MazE/SpoVT family DNA-binding domain-containing protein [Thermoprotei archaeon]